ncbi:MAG: DUF2236 domain-containing protein [Actinobacteria bacterium]|nr:DUF2236 domain-containing protein [Actinomycetota bacterium]
MDASSLGTGVREPLLREPQPRRAGARERPAGVPIPAGPHDWGLFGPGSVSWRVHSNPVLLVGGLRALLIQSLNPLAMAGIDQHSDYLERPLSRLQRTASYVATIVFGDTATAERTGEMVTRLHSRVAGIDPITASAYSAQDLETMLWVHCVEIHSFLAAYRAYGGRMSDDEQDAYLREQVAAAELLGIPGEVVPASRRDYGVYFEVMRDRLCVSEASRNAIELVVAPPLTRELLPHQPALRTMAAAAVAITPRYIRRLTGTDRSRLTCAAAGAATRVAGVVFRIPPLDRSGGRLVGARTVSLPRAALAAAREAGV